MAIRRPTLMLTVVLALGAPALAAEPPNEAHAETHAPEGVQVLSAPLREALGAEMLALQAGLMGVIPAVVAGRWDEVAKIGLQMRDSYIMKQALTAEQRRELHHALPAGFLELDERFHYLAGMLSHAAEAKKPELVGFYIGTMTETCITCHARYAREKFPALSDTPAGHRH